MVTMKIHALRYDTYPFDDKRTSHISVPLADAVNPFIIICIAAAIVNEMQVFEQVAKQNEILSVQSVSSTNNEVIV